DARGKHAAGIGARAVKVAVRGEHQRSHRVMTFVVAERVHRQEATVEVHAKYRAARVILFARADRARDRRSPDIARLGLDQWCVRTEALRDGEVMEDGEVSTRVDPVDGSAGRGTADEIAIPRRHPVKVPVAGEQEGPARKLAVLTSGKFVNRRDVA